MAIGERLFEILTTNTITSDSEFLSSDANVRQPLILYETITKTPAKQAIGMCFANGIMNNIISNKTTAWMMPATGVRPPLLMLVMVRAMEIDQ